MQYSWVFLSIDPMDVLRLITRFTIFLVQQKYIHLYLSLYTSIHIIFCYMQACMYM